MGLARIYPGHGPVVDDPAAKLDEYISHRLERERRIVAALDAGARTEDELLAAAWDEVPPRLRLPAAWTLQAHLEKLRSEGRLPEGV
jgi:glyoxylase-like metal-dependent hydrolase (beta-lactamase superfamily II)